MVEQGERVLERDVSETSAPVWVRYWQRLGWAVVGKPEVVGDDGAGHRVLDFHLRAARGDAVVPPVRTQRDQHVAADGASAQD